MAWPDTAAPRIDEHEAQPGRLPERVADRLKRLIAELDLQTGMRLPSERELCHRFAVSRTVLREAVRILEQQGTVHVMPARGIFVASRGLQSALDRLSEQLRNEGLGFEELVEARRFLEEHAGELAAARRTAEDLNALEAAFTGMRAAFNEPEVFLEQDLRFHFCLAQAAGNRLFAVWLQPIMQNLLVTRQKITVLRPVRERILACHEEILAAVRDRDPGRTRAAIADHLDEFVADTAMSRDIGLF